MISVILTIKNRAHLLKWALESLVELNHTSQGGKFHLIDEILIADGGSNDNLKEIIQNYSSYFDRIALFNLDRSKSPYNHVNNCPAWEYNFLVSKAKNDIIIKIDPEVCIITPTFIEKGLEILKTNQDAIFMPFCYHNYDYYINSLDDIKKNYLDYYYQTHLTEQGVNNGVCRLIYYACMFRKQSYIDLGGIDMRFVEGIGSEDDHFFDQWERKYGKESVISTTEEKCVHLWHGIWGKEVPAEFSDLVMKNRILRDELKEVYPNNGDFNSVKY